MNAVEAAQAITLCNSDVSRWEERGDRVLGANVAEDFEEGGFLANAVGSFRVRGEVCSICHTIHANCTLHRSCGSGQIFQYDKDRRFGRGTYGREGDEGRNLRESLRRRGTGAGERWKDGAFVVSVLVWVWVTEERKVFCELPQEEQALAAV